MPVVITGRRKSKLEAPKTKSAAALVKRKNSNAQKKQDDADSDVLDKEPCQFVPVRRKPLGEYMNLKEPISSTSSSLQSMPMSYADVIQSGLDVKVMITPLITKSNNTGKSTATKKSADTNFRAFDEQPKPHLFRVEPKVFRTDVEQKSKIKGCKPKKPIVSNIQKPGKTKMRRAAKTDPDDADFKGLEFKFKELSCNAPATATVAAVPKLGHLNLMQDNSLLAASNGHVKHQNKSPVFADSVSYLNYHQKRLQQMIKKQTICVLCSQSPEPMEVPHFEDNRFKFLEEAALCTQNRTMVQLYLNSDQRISK